MDPKRQLEVLASTIPQLYEATVGTYPVDFTFEGQTIRRWTFNRLTPELREYKRQCLELLEAFRVHRQLYPGTHEENKLTEYFAMIWLKIFTGVEKNLWNQIFNYFYQLNRRTNENSFIHKSIKLKKNITSDTTHELNLQNSKLNKVIDLLGSGTTTNLVVDTKLNILNIESIDPTQTPARPDYVFYPEFIGSQVESCDEESVLITSTVKGDLLVCFKRKLIASKRRDKWTIYDPNTFKNTIRDIVGGDYRLGCNLYGILLDLSYRRHGGLIVLDRHANFANPNYVKPSPPTFHDLLPATRFDSVGVNSSEKKRLLEFSSVDGAVLIAKDSGQIHSFGRIVKTHPDCGEGGYGARSTAAESAVRFGGIAFKASSDGDISLIFKTQISGDEIIKIDYL